MKLILHIGSGKTGTTTLQQTLAASREVLLQHGVLYPSFDGRAEHHSACVFMRPDDLPRELRQPGAPAADELRRRTEIQLEAAFAEATRRGAHSVLLSSEYLFYRASHEVMGAFAKRLKSTSREVVVACYLRDPVSWYLASVAQVIRASHRIKRLQEPNYANILDSYAAHFNVSARTYRRDALSNGDVVADFLDNFLPTVPAAPVLARRKNTNSSLSAEGVDILWSYRRHIHPERPGIFTKDSNRLYRELLGAEQKVEGAAPLTGTDAVKTAVLRLYAPQAQRVRAYGIDFGAPLPAAQASSPASQPTTPQAVLQVDIDRRERLLNELIKALVERNLCEPGN